MNHNALKKGALLLLFFCVLSIGFMTPVSVRALSLSETFYSVPILKQMTAPVLTGVNANQAGLTVSWKPVSGATKYRVLRRDGKKWISIGETNKCQFTDLTVSNNRLYTYDVVCCMDNGQNISSLGIPVIGIRLDTPVVTAVSGDEGTNISWHKIANAKWYRVFRWENGKWKALTNTSATSYVDKNGKADMSDRYTVRCLSADGKQWESYFTPVKGRFLPSPVITRTETTTIGVKLTWNAVKGASQYRVFYKASNGWIKLTDTKALTFEDKGVKEGGSRTYTVRCLSASGTKYTSSFLPGVAGKRLSIPVVSFYAEKDKIKLSWSAVSGAEGYVVYGQSGSSWERIGTTEKTSFSVSAVSGNTVRYTVRCASKDGKNLYSLFQPTWGRYTSYSYRGVSRQMAGNGTFSQTGGLSSGQQQAIQIYLNAYYSALGSFVNSTGGVFDNTKIREREQTIWNSVIAVRKEAFEDLSLTRYRVSGRVSSVKKVDANTVKVTVWVSCNQQFRDIPVLSQVYDNENWFTLKKDKNGTWWVSNHDADCSPFYHFQYDEKTKTDLQLSTMLYYAARRKAAWNASTAKPGGTVSCDHPYNREKAKTYLLQWINKRNPDWFVYDPYGGNCMNFGSQVLVNGGIHQTSKWFWTPSGHTDSWTCVGDFADYAEKATRQELCCDTHANYFSGDVGDLVLIGITAPRNHTTVISGLVKTDQGTTIDYLLSCNTSDLKNFPAAAYHYTNQHLIRIFGWDD